MRLDKTALERKAKVLAISRLTGMGPARFKKLAAEAGSVETMWELLCQGRAVVPGLQARQLSELRTSALAQAAPAVEAAQQAGIGMLDLFDEAYPADLKEAYDPPAILYWKGELGSAWARPRVAVVGARRATPYGVRMARRIAAGLSRAGVTVVSGLALGIDAAAHEGTIEAGGAGWAVLGGAVDRIYPKENAPLASRLLESGGLLLSEYGPGTVARPEFFPARNRILAALCRAVVVVEADSKSGALITADAALAEGREVFAVPGPADSELSKGTHGLLRQGAGLAASAEDILQGLGLADNARGATASSGRELAGLPEDEKALAKLLLAGPLSMDDLVMRGAGPIPAVSESLLRLEIKGRVRALPGGIYSLTEG